MIGAGRPGDVAILGHIERPNSEKEFAPRGQDQGRNFSRDFMQPSQVVQGNAEQRCQLRLERAVAGASARAENGTAVGVSL